MKRVAGLVLVLCGATALGAKSARYADMTDAEVSQAITNAQKVKDLGARMVVVSEPFLGTPYVLGNMGEGPDGDGRDTDPRYNVKTADCTTFVEHAMAFALSRDLAEAKGRLDAIRYAKGVVGYGTRRHWPDAQWVPGLVGEGFLEEATRAVAGADGKVETATVTIDASAFAASAHAKSMPLKPGEVPKGTFAIPFIPLDDVRRHVDRMETGMVMNIVKVPKDGLLVRISHQSLVVKKGKDVFIRNASSVGPKAVVDEPLGEFVERQKKAGWKTAGFEFLRVREKP